VEKGYKRAEHIRSDFLSLNIKHMGVKLCATLSLGVAVFPHHGDTWEGVLHTADWVMYAAKDAGKNCTHTAR
jgi:PleD family two-component response regulator